MKTLELAGQPAYQFVMNPDLVDRVPELYLTAMLHHAFEERLQSRSPEVRERACTPRLWSLKARAALGQLGMVVSEVESVGGLRNVAQQHLCRGAADLLGTCPGWAPAGTLVVTPSGRVHLATGVYAVWAAGEGLAVQLASHPLRSTGDVSEPRFQLGGDVVVGEDEPVWLFPAAAFPTKASRARLYRDARDAAKAGLL